MKKLEPVKLEVIGMCGACKGEATHKLYKHPDRVNKVLVGIYCEKCCHQALDLSQGLPETGTTLAISTAEKGNNDNNGKQ